MVELFAIFVLACHLLCMNVAAAGPLVSAWLELRDQSPGTAGAKAADFLACITWKLLLGGAALGILLGWALWTPRYSDLWTLTLRHKAIFGVAEFFFSLVLMLIYVWWRRGQTAAPSTATRLGRSVLLVLSATNLLYHFPLLFAVATSVASQPELPTPLTNAEFRGWMTRPDVLARAVHVVLASFAVTGVALIWMAGKVHRQDPDALFARIIARWGAWWALLPSLAQMVVGLWLVASLPSAWQERVMGADTIATLCLVGSLLMVLWLLQDLAALALGDFEPVIANRVIILMLVIVLLMTATLRRMHPTVDAAAVAPLTTPLEGSQP